MSKHEVKNLPTSVHDQLLFYARQHNRTYQEILQYYAIERFLFRLTRSEYAKQFVLKGALLFRVWDVAFRPTRDIDLLGYTRNDVRNLETIIKSICSQHVEADGLQFDPKSVKAERIIESGEYAGVRIQFTGRLEPSHINMQIDVGFGDLVSPAPAMMVYPGILSHPVLKIRGYSMETVIAEKLQIMIKLGMINSHLKDYHDIWILARKFNFSGAVIQKSIKQTFIQRKTDIPSAMPPALSDEFSHAKENQWVTFLHRNMIDGSPIRFDQIIVVLRMFAMPILESITEGRTFNKKWLAGGPWR